MSNRPTGHPLTSEGTPVDLSVDPRVAGLVSMLREVSAVRDPAKVLQAFGPWVGGRFPRDAFISVSKRDLPHGKFKFTRVISSTTDPTQTLRSTGNRDPWSEWRDLPTYEGGIVGRILARDEPQIIRGVDFGRDPVLGPVLGEHAGRYRSVTAVPAYDDGEALNWSLSFHAHEDWDNLDAFMAGLLDINLMGTATRNLVYRRQSDSLNAQLMEQFEQIAKIQLQLLPDQNPRLEGLTLSTSYLTSHVAGGDYFDYMQGENGRLGIVIADVSGHGPGAATVMAMIRTILSCYQDTTVHKDNLNRIDVVARYCNDKLVQSNLNGEFATAFFCIIDPGSGRLTWTRCGHNPPLLRRADGTIEQIESAATLPLGIMEHDDFETDSCVMNPGDTLILYTDGITEATATRPRHEFSMHAQSQREHRPEQFGIDRLAESLDTCSGDPGCAIDHIHRALFKFTNRLDRDDDQTLVVIRREPAGERGGTP